MYRPAAYTGDAVPVPQAVFSRLAAKDADDLRFRVVLYLLARGECEANQVAAALRVKTADVEKALHYWEGVGVLECDLPCAELSEPQAKARRHLHTDEMLRAAESDAKLGAMMGELQRIFGGLLSQKDFDIAATLYCQDGFAADLILMAAHQCAVEGKNGALPLERKLLGWQKEGISDCEAADIHLQKLARRAEREEQVAKLLGLKETHFTLPERKHIAEWFEGFGYGCDMLDAARLNAGEQRNEVNYLHKILKKWHTKGYKTPRDVAAAGEGRNMRAERGAPVQGGAGGMIQAVFVPPQRKRGNG